MVKASELPTDLLNAFVDALDAWTLVEHELFMLFQLVRGGGNLDTRWLEFTDLTPRGQREKTLEFASERIPEPTLRSLGALMRRVTKLSTKRNRIVHGRWAELHVMAGGRHIQTDFLRLYEGRGAGLPRPRTGAEADAMLGSTRFTTKELRVAERDFRALARDLHCLIEPISKFIIRRLP